MKVIAAAQLLLTAVDVMIGDELHWGTTVTEPQATVGGAGLDPAAPGVRVAQGMTWFVLALDGDGLPIAQSAAQPIPG